MMQPMILMEKTCKEAVSASNSPANLGIAEGAAAAVVVAEDLEVVTEETEVAEAVGVTAAADLGATVAGPGATHLDPGPTTDWSWKICLHVLLGRI